MSPHSIRKLKIRQYRKHEWGNMQVEAYRKCIICWHQKREPRPQIITQQVLSMPVLFYPSLFRYFSQEPLSQQVLLLWRRSLFPLWPTCWSLIVFYLKSDLVMIQLLANFEKNVFPPIIKESLGKAGTGRQAALFDCCQYLCHALL